MSPEKNDNFFISVRNLVNLLGDTHTPTLAVGLSSFALILGLKLYRRTRKIPGALVLVVVFIIVMIIWNKSISSHGSYARVRDSLRCCAAVSSLSPAVRILVTLLSCCVPVSVCVHVLLVVVGPPHRLLRARLYAAPDTKLGGGYITEAGVKIVGKMDSAFPTPSMPDLGRASSVLVTAVFVMFVGIVEAISVAKTYGVLKGYEIDPTREFVALGCANIVGSLFGTLPSLSPLSRSAINSDAGARSQLSLMVR